MGALLLLAALFAGAGATAPAAASDPLPEAVDVLVLGSEPEAIAAAVAAAESGARTLLVTPDPRLGGLFVLGQLNVLDLRTQPRDYQAGIFGRWWRRVGRGTAFDVDRAERAFGAMLADAGVRVVRGEPAPLVEGERVVGARVRGADGGERTVRAAQVIDGTADADHAAAAGAGWSFGWQAFGLDVRMVDTLVFRIDGLAWDELRRATAAQGRDFARVDDRVAWGSFGGIPAAYRATEPGLRLRGLNLGRQDDGSVLVNALLIYGVDPFDPASRAEGRARAEREAPRVVAYLAARLPGFGDARYGGVAERLYVRETRHLEARCTLTVDDLADNRVTPLDVAAGGYPMDVQTLQPSDNGFVYGVPEIYGGRLCHHVPVAIDGLWVVGRASGYDPVAHSSARVVPFGMAQAEAVGVAAALGAERGVAPSRLADDPAWIRVVRAELERRGAYLPSVAPRAPIGPAAHPHYDAFRVLLRRGLALGGYGNDPNLDAPMPALGQLYLLSNVGDRFAGVAGSGAALVARFGLLDGPLTIELAVELYAAAACELASGASLSCPGEASLGALRAAGWVVPAEAAGWAAEAGRGLTRGEAYAFAAALARSVAPGAAEGR